MTRRLCLCLVLAAGILPSGLQASTENAQALYRVDLAGIGSCYDADLTLMLPGHVFAYLQPGSLEVSFRQPPDGIQPKERVMFLGDMVEDFPAEGSKYMAGAVLGREVLLAFDSVMRDPSGALLAYVYLPRDGTCVNLKLIRDGYARVAPDDVAFQFRREFEMYEQQAKEKRRGIWGP